MEVYIIDFYIYYHSIIILSHYLYYKDIEENIRYR